MDVPQCLSIKSKKNPTKRCESNATKGEFCARHYKSKILWISPTRPLTRSSTKQHEKIFAFWTTHGRRYLRRLHGPATFVPELSHNDKDIYSYDAVQTIPLTYRFSYVDDTKHLWTFDLRFLLNLFQYGNELKNPFSQQNIPGNVIERLQRLASIMRKRNQPIVYTEKDTLTPEQLWNQKVLDVFLKLTALGYGVNVLWFESLTPMGHEAFYRSLYNLWNVTLPKTHQEREKIVPGYLNEHAPLFRWSPEDIQNKSHILKWWRKQTLGLMNAFLSRGQDKDTQGCGALYILTALAQIHPRAAQAFPWLASYD